MQAEAEAESVRVSWGMASDWHEGRAYQGFLFSIACFLSWLTWNSLC